MLVQFMFWYGGNPTWKGSINRNVVSQTYDAATPESRRELYQFIKRTEKTPEIPGGVTGKSLHRRLGIY